MKYLHIVPYHFIHETNLVKNILQNVIKLDVMVSNGEGYRKDISTFEK